MGSYYESEDLKKFTDIKRVNKELGEKFFEYYNDVLKTEGALTKREKTLIALATAHSQQCPYCIDAYTQSALQQGIDEEQMNEAIHVVAAVTAGVKLVHGVQMMNKIDSLSF